MAITSTEEFDGMTKLGAKILRSRLSWAYSSAG